MVTQSNPLEEREHYVARFRRDLNSLTKAINNPNKALQRVVVKSRRTGKPLAVMIAPGTYEADLSQIKALQKHINDLPPTPHPT